MAKSKKIENLFAEIMTEYDNRRFKRCIKLCQSLLKLDPHYEEVQLKICQCYGLLNWNHKAVSKLNHLLKNNPRRIAVLLERAWNYIKTEQLIKAKEDIEKCLLIDPKNMLAHFYLGEIYYKNRDYLMAVRECTICVENDVAKAHSLYNRSLCYYHLGIDHAALEDSTQSLYLNPSDVNTLVHHSEMLAKLYDYENALEFIEKAIALDPSRSSFYLHRAYICYCTRNYIKGISDLTHSLSLLPDQLIAIQRRAHLFTLIGDFESAMQDYVWAAELNLKDPEEDLRQSRICWQKLMKAKQVKIRANKLKHAI